MSGRRGRDGVVLPTELDEPCPCDDCDLYAACASGPMACAAYWFYQHDADWREIDRYPNHNWYRVTIEGRPQALRWARRDSERAREAA